MSTPQQESGPAATVPGEPVEPSAPGSAYPWGASPPAPPLPAEPPPAPRRPQRLRRTVLTGLLAALAVAALGAPLGVLWAFVAPGVPVTQAEGGPVLTDPQPEQFVAADGWFSGLGLIFGVLAAIGMWWVLRRSRGPVGLVALACGSLAAAGLAWWLGRRIGLDDYQQWRATAAIGEAYLRPPDLRAGTVGLLWGFLPTVRGDLLVPAFGAVVTYTLLAGWAEDSDLGSQPDRPGGPAHWPDPDPDSNANPNSDPDPSSHPNPDPSSRPNPDPLPAETGIGADPPATTGSPAPTVPGPPSARQSPTDGGTDGPPPTESGRARPFGTD